MNNRTVCPDGEAVPVDFFDKIQSLTEQNKIDWVTLPEYFSSHKNEPLRKLIIRENSYAYEFSKYSHKKAFKNEPSVIDEYNSYISSVAGGVLVLIHRLHRQNSGLEFMVQTSTTKLPVFIICTNNATLQKLYDTVSDSGDISQYMQKIFDL